jgi:hypothetical protein
VYRCKDSVHKKFDDTCKKLHLREIYTYYLNVCTTNIQVKCRTGHNQHGCILYSVQLSAGHPRAESLPFGCTLSAGCRLQTESCRQPVPGRLSAVRDQLAGGILPIDCSLSADLCPPVVCNLSVRLNLVRIPGSMDQITKRLQS